MMPLTVVEFLLRLRNITEQPKSGFSINHKEIALLWRSLYFSSISPQVDRDGRLHANIAAPGMCPCSSVDRASALLEP